MISTLLSIPLLPKKCAAFTWDPQGGCHGILLFRQNERYQIAGTWEAGAENNTATAISETLASGYKTLVSGESIPVFAGPETLDWDSAELLLPHLPQEDLQAAISFELKKIAPLPPEQLVWGFRALPQENATPAEKFRILYLRKTTWEQWLEAIAAFPYLDLLAPAPFLLDPLAQGKSVSFSQGESHVTEKGRILLPGQKTSAPCRLTDLFPEIEAPELPSPEKWTGAIVLALFGLSQSFSKAALTLPPLPENKRPHRHLYLKILRNLLLCLICFFLLTGIFFSCQRNSLQIQKIEKQIQDCQKEIQTLQKEASPKYKEAAQAFETELQRYRFQKESLPEVLAELTLQILPPSWLAGGFTWKASPMESGISVTFVLREPLGTKENENLASRLNASPILGDVKEQQTLYGKNQTVDRKFSLTVRPDLPGENAGQPQTPDAVPDDTDAGAPEPTENAGSELQKTLLTVPAENTPPAAGTALPQGNEQPRTEQNSTSHTEEPEP